MKTWIASMKRITLAVALVCFGAAAHAAEVVVLESTSSKLAPGQAVSSEMIISLKTGQLVSVLTVDGRTLVRKGPYEGALASGAPKGWNDSLAVVSSLISEAETERKRLGATRTFSEGSRPMAHHIDISQSQTFCAKDTAKIFFWRPINLATDSEFTLKNEQFGPDALKGYWLGKDQTLEWPPGLPIPFGTPLLMRMPGKGVATEVDLIRVPDSVDDGFGSIVWMTRAGCKDQAMRLLSELRTATN